MVKKLKIRSREEINKVVADAWLNLDVDEQHLYNPLSTTPEEFEESPHLYIVWLMSRPEYFSFICKEVLNIELLPMQAVILQELWKRKFPMLIQCRGGGKTFLVAVYNWIRMLLLPNRKIIIAGSVFRQSKLVFEYMEIIWNNSSVLRDAVGLSTKRVINHGNDRWTCDIGNSQTYAIPTGAGDRIRGYRANDIEMEEFAASSREVFEVVIAGFGAVAANPIENVKKNAALQKLKELGIELDEEDDDEHHPNQIIISGTASYDFNHFSEYHKKWHQIIMSGGDKKKIAELHGGEQNIADEFDWKDYSIIRIPLKLMPKGFMDAASIARSKATMHAGLFSMEYGACFSKDSKGFFKRTLIEKCVVSPQNEVVHPSGPVMFNPVLTGTTGKNYVMAVDAASDIDLFAIIINEVCVDHQRISYLWTTNKESHRAELKSGFVTENSFYSYCARKIRDLMKTFQIQRIAIDSQGGGGAVMEALNDNDKIEAGEHYLYPVIDEEKPKDTDDMSGLHIIDVINFASAEWTVEANHGLRKDFEMQAMLFPYFDAASLGLSSAYDNLEGRKYDTLEECILNIEELKDELSTIVMTKTVITGRDKWDTPEIKLPGNKKGRMRKDRYSALVMANWSGRQIMNTSPPTQYNMSGGFAGGGGDTDGIMYVAPDWFSSQMNNVY